MTGEHPRDESGVAPYTEEEPAISTRSTEGDLLGGDELGSPPTKQNEREVDQPASEGDAPDR